MAQEETVQGNPETPNQQQAEDSVFGSENFFDQLEEGVNGMVSEGHPESPTTDVTPSDNGPQQETHVPSQQGSNVDWDNSANPYKKRYADSSRESVKMAQQLKSLRPFAPVLNAMRKDAGLVEHVRSYFQEGGQPSKTVQKKLDLPEDFEFDGHEAMTEPNSDSAKVMNAQVDTMVQHRVNDILKKEKVNSMRVQENVQKKKEEADFKQKTGMSDADFSQMKTQAQKHKLTLDDIHYLLNKNKTQQNVANATKQDMLNQMKNVRDIPTSAGDANSQAQSMKPDDRLFDTLLESDNGADDLFG